MSAGQKPKGMPQEQWDKIKDLNPELRKSFASLYDGITNSPLPASSCVSSRLPVQLPLWPEAVRGAPNSFLRSALFAAIQGKTRQYLKAKPLGSQGNYAVKFTGAQLDQADLDTWEQAAHLAKCQPLGNVCLFKGNAFLKAMGRSNGKSNYTWLNESLTRLVACAVEIRCGKKVFTGSLVSSFVRDEETGLYKITLDPDILKLFGSYDWSSVEWVQRLALKGKPLALWLHGYIASHAEPVPVKIETLRKMSGSKGVLRNFKISLKRAFSDLEKVAGISASFEGDLVHIKKDPTAAQTRHLTKKKRPDRKG